MVNTHPSISMDKSFMIFYGFLYILINISITVSDRSKNTIREMFKLVGERAGGGQKVIFFLMAVPLSPPLNCITI